MNEIQRRATEKKQNVATVEILCDIRNRVSDLSSPLKKPNPLNLLKKRKSRGFSSHGFHRRNSSALISTKLNRQSLRLTNDQCDFSQYQRESAQRRLSDTKEKAHAAPSSRRQTPVLCTPTLTRTCCLRLPSACKALLAARKRSGSVKKSGW